MNPIPPPSPQVPTNPNTHRFKETAGEFGTLTRKVPQKGAKDLQAARRRLRSSHGPDYWQSLEEVARTDEFLEFVQREFPDRASEWLGDFDRRGFLKLMGASLALAGLTSCTKQPEEKIIPYVKQPEEMDLGEPLFYATAMTLGGFATGLLAESREGHPVKIEGNPDHPMSLGATHVLHQASLLDLYDPDRSQAVLNGGHISSWEAFLATLQAAMQTQQGKEGAGLRILTETVTSPTLAAQLDALMQKFPQARWHLYESESRDAVRDGARLAFGEFVETQHDFSKAHVVLSLESDFLYGHPAALRYARAFADRRRVSSGERFMNRLYVVESTPTVTGSNADHRLPVEAMRIEVFARELARELEVPGAAPADSLPPDHLKWIAAIAKDLQAHRGDGIVIAGAHQPAEVHALVHAINRALDNIGTTVFYTDTAEANPANRGKSLQELAEALQNEEVDLLVMLGGNPAYQAPADLEFSRLLAKAALSVHLSPEVNETSALCQWHVPQNHYLESWSDARAFDGTVSIIQPLILPLYDGKSAHEVINALIGNQPNQGDYQIVRDHWKSRGTWTDFEKGWRRALHDGIIPDTAKPARTMPWKRTPSPDENNTVAMRQTAPSLEVAFRPDPNLRDGRFANNGWLQELAKPITKITWDNPALISPALAEEFNLANGDIVELEASGRRLQVPVWITPGQAARSITLHLGSGRNRVGRTGTGVGFDVGSLRTAENFWNVREVGLTRTERRHSLATTQTHHVIDSDERQVFREGTLTRFLDDPEFVQNTTELPDPNTMTLFHPEEHRYDGYHWGMSIDLTACIGCNACVLACQSENNIPVVGKEQVALGREMQWIRIDTYFHGSLDRPQMNHQPVPCMQCENAPCELVCPVAATLHDKEGLNLQVYNRCIGTRYCSNNCPYKVRRFNFLQYSDTTTPTYKAMRNPEVTVRSRGVMEKCSYCIQRISSARITAKKAGREIRDGEIQTACQQVCPAEAIVFGDIGNPDSRVAKLKAHPLDFSMLGQLNTRPRTTYLAKLRNPNPDLNETP